MQLSRSIEISRPVTDVHSFVVDSNNDPRWCQMVLHSELVAGSAGEPGARYQQVQRPGPVGRNLDVRLLEADPPKRALIRSSTSAATFDVEYQLEETDGGCRLTQNSDVSFRGVGRLSRPLVHLVLPKNTERQLQDLKTLLERSA